MKHSRFKCSLILAFLVTSLSPELAEARVVNGFNLSNSLIPEDRILRGGVPRDGIPAIDRPKFISARRAQQSFEKGTRAIVIEMGKEKKAYPIPILNWHEIVNDSINGKSVLVTYCPLTDTGMVFDPTLGGKSTEFGVSGLLFQGNLIMYDRKTESLWSQLGMEGITGEHKGKSLRLLNSQVVELGEYLKKNPSARVLSKDTGFARNYSKDPYADYRKSQDLYFPVDPLDTSRPMKSWTLLIAAPRQSLAIPLDELGQAHGERTMDLGGKSVRFHYDVKSRTVNCKSLPPDTGCIGGFWFALRAFYPASQIFGREGSRRQMGGEKDKLPDPELLPGSMTERDFQRFSDEKKPQEKKRD